MAGLSVIVADAKPSPARKFLMAGKSGLNLTKSEPISAFLAHIHGPDSLRKIVGGFGPEEVQEWAKAHGQEVFTGSSGRVFPKVMKASPLLRNWLARLDQAGVELRRNWRWLVPQTVRCSLTRLKVRKPYGQTSPSSRWAGPAGRAWGLMENGSLFLPKMAFLACRSSLPTWGSSSRGPTIWRVTSANL